MMRHDSPTSRGWIAAISVAAFFVALLNGREIADSPVAGIIAAVVLTGAVAMQLFPASQASGDDIYRPAMAFLLVAAILIYPVPLAPFAVLCTLPVWLRERNEPGSGIRWLTATIRYTLAAFAVSTFVRRSTLHQVQNLSDLLTLLGAGSLFFALNLVLSGLTSLLVTRTRLHQTPILQPAALLADGLFCLFGIAVADVWFAAPLMLVLLLPTMVIVHRLTYTAHLAAVADMDAKTGLHNSRYFERITATELPTWTRRGIPVTVLFADLDHFKMINDRYGHIAGDTVLRDVATLITTSLRRGDIIARFGGEEFVALLPDVDAQAALVLAERIRTTIEGHIFTLDTGESAHCTISIGTASTPDDGATMPTLIAQADRAMYRAKQTRNTTRQAHTLAVAFRPTRETQTVATPRPLRDWRGLLAPVLLWATIMGGAFAACFSLIAVQRAGGWSALPAFIALAVLAGLFPIQLYEADGGKLSFSFTFAVTMAAITIQPLAAPLVQLVAAVVHVVRRRQRRLDRVLFNLSNPLLAAACAGGVYFFLAPNVAGITPMQIVAIGLSAITFYVVNTGVLSIMITLNSRQSLWQVLRQSGQLLPIELLLGLTGAFIGTVYYELGATGTIIFAVPLLLMYVTLSVAARKSQQAMSTLATAKTQVEQANAEKATTLSQLIETLSSIIDARDTLVWGHSRNVATYAAAIAGELGLSGAEVDRVYTAGLLHDLGKVAIPEAILRKAAPLTPEEFIVIKEHASIGRRILVDAPLLQPIAEMVGDHHERYDGHGYPTGRQGEQISMGGRILAVADALDTILSDRVYSRGKPLAWAMREITQCAGGRYDPRVVTALERVVQARGPEFFRNTPLALPLGNNIVTAPRPLVNDAALAE